MLRASRARKSSRSCVTICFTPPSSFLSSLTRSAYRNVFSVCSQQLAAGETLAIIVVLLLPVKESFNTCVSLLPRNGRCAFDKSNARMHSFNANRDLLISAPSLLVCLLLSTVSAPRSLPARSMKLILPIVRPSLLFLRASERIACDRELSALAPVVPLMRTCNPLPITYMTPSTDVMVYSVSPTMFTFCLASSRQCNTSRLFSKSKSLPQ